MNRPQHMTSFWSGGQKSLVQALKDEEAGKLRVLRSKLDITGDPSIRDQLKGEIASAKREYKAKRKDAQTSLFITKP